MRPEAQSAGGTAAVRRTNQLHLRQKRRRQRTLKNVLRLASVTLGGALGAYLAFAFLAKVVHPYKLGYDVSRQSDGVHEELEKQRRANEKLRAQLAFLKTDEGAEVEARRAHWHRPGETVILFRQDPPAAPPASPAPAP